MSFRYMKMLGYWYDGAKYKRALIANRKKEVISLISCAFYLEGAESTLEREFAMQFGA